MDANKYQILAQRTMCDQDEVLLRISTFGSQAVQLNHAVNGMAGEVGEIASAIEKWLWYKQDLDETNVVEELGDLCWYIAEACSALGVTIGYVMEKNILKLRERYPEKYTDEKAAEHNRNREAEREILGDLTESQEARIDKVLAQQAVEESDKMVVENLERKIEALRSDTLAALLARARDRASNVAEKTVVISEPLYTEKQCGRCGGTGNLGSPDIICPDCEGYGIKKWVNVAGIPEAPAQTAEELGIDLGGATHARVDKVLPDSNLTADAAIIGHAQQSLVPNQKPSEDVLFQTGQGFAESPESTSAFGTELLTEHVLDMLTQYKALALNLTGWVDGQNSKKAVEEINKLEALESKELVNAQDRRRA